MSKLVLWSGGADSTYTLKKLLEETTDKIYALHIIYNQDVHKKLSKQQFNAVQKIHGELLNIREFDLHNAVIDFDIGVEFAGTIMAAFIGGQFCRSFPDITEVWVGGNADDVKQDLYDIKTDKRVELQTQAVQCGVYDPTRTLTYHWHEATRLEEKEFLGPLWDLSWSCTNPSGPKYNQPCKKCISCKERDV